MIVISDLGVRYGRGRMVVHEANLTISKGLYGLLGPHGAGKSTLLRVLATLLRPSRGDVAIAGYSVRRDRLAIRRLIGYMPQVVGFYPQLRVWETLDYLARLSGLTDSAVRREHVQQVLMEVNLADRAHDRVKTLSGDLVQYLGIAQALAHDPQIIIADEPTAGLDPAERVRLRALLTRLAVDRTVILSTPIVSDIAAVCPQVAVLHRGRIIFAGPTPALAAQARGRLWQATVSDDEVGAFLRGEWPVAQLTRTPEGTAVRLVAPALAGFARVVAAPSVEEGYLALLGKEAQA